MNFMIFDDAGNAIESFDDGLVARAALRGIVMADPSAVGELALFTFDDDGRVVGEP